jgi:hypothetical protein
MSDKSIPMDVIMGESIGLRIALQLPDGPPVSDSP